MAGRPIYLDHNASTPVDPRVLEEMTPYFLEEYGNASSRTHAYGWKAEEALERARDRVAALVGARRPASIIFTSGATESNNLAITGVARAASGRRRDQVVTQRTEHKCVVEACRQLEKTGLRVTTLPVDRDGRVDPEDVARAVDDRTLLVSIMYANNEVGTIQPIREIGRITRERGAILHCDAVQAVGHIPVDVEEAGIDLMSISAHKMYGPKGIGALYVAPRRPAIRIEPLMRGGDHELGLRPGTVNVPGAVGLGAAAEIGRLEMDEHAKRIGDLRDRLAAALAGRIDGLHRNGHPTARLPGNLNVSVELVEGESLIMSLPELALATGSACSSSTVEPSYVLRAMGRSAELAHSSLRIGLGRGTTVEEVDRAADCIVAAVERLRAMSPLARRMRTAGRRSPAKREVTS